MTNGISIAILTKNGGATFLDVLASIRNQECPVPYRLVILDSGSRDGTPEAARKAGAVIHTIPPEDFSFGESRDLLFSRCEGEIIATLSQDAVPQGPRWLERLTAPIREGRADVVQGVEEPDGKRFYWERIGRFYTTSEWRPFLKRYGQGLSGVNLAVARSSWEATGFGPIPMCCDKLFQKRVAEAGLRVVVCPEASVMHGHEYDTRTLFKRCANEGMALRHLGFTIKPWASARDMLSPANHRAAFRGLARGQVRSPAELFFPILRPLGIWYGNRFLSGFWR